MPTLLHSTSDPTTLWTRANLAEGIPGVCTPLSWTFWKWAEQGWRLSFYDMGLFSRKELRAGPGAGGDELFTIFYGRPAANVERWRDLADRIPGTSGDAVEEQYTGAVRPRATSRARWDRYPFVILRFPALVVRLPRRLGGLSSEVERWWRSTTGPDGRAGDPETARAVFSEALHHFASVHRLHSPVSLVCQGLFDIVTKLCRRAGLEGHEQRLVTGYGGYVEMAMLVELHQVALGQRSLDAFVDGYGYHGPLEGQLDARSWREDSAPLRALLDSYRKNGDDPGSALDRQRTERLRAEADLLAALRGARRWAARAVLALCRRYLPLRELGKSAFLRCVDSARAAARTLGRAQVTGGSFRSGDDVFYLTVDEVLADRPLPDPDTIEARRRERDRYCEMELPEFFEGPPQPVQPQPMTRAAGNTLHGMGVSPGIVEGTARVVLDPGAALLEPGEVLVAPVTDPAWAPLFMVAAGLVIDIGGPLSHGAIIARELGVPCVINTAAGTSVIRSGDIIRMDGSSGEITILERAIAPGGEEE